MRRIAWPMTLTFLLLSGLALAEGGHAAPVSDGMQCGQRLVSVGDSKLAVVGKCGQPDLKETRTEQRRDERGRSVWVTVDQWSYDRGEKRFLRVLSFEEGRLTTIEAVSR